MRKLITAICATALLALLSHTVHSASFSEGNASTKQETLSADNTPDIKADLTALNDIIKKSDTFTKKLPDELWNAMSSPNKETKEKAFENMISNFEKTNEQLINWQVKSKEIQEIKEEFITINELSSKITKYLNHPDKLSEQDIKEMLLLQNKLIPMQAGFQQHLDKLNAKHNK
ncbi:hypothetical protein [Serratia sp. DD3]|uniref:hypothetical protein n=1 Tax=Serratia sp. DD3 TaxID=1410619 RepID=UPI0003C52B9C|nr:hypothetical protein [Serratia sp. DD3]KEY57510.1 hypothetical protein SRDD_34910 [Serratia sp. DD3]